MKSFKSAVFTVTAALFLAVSLVGCKKNDAQTTMNNGGLNEGMESIASDSNKVRLVLKPGLTDFVLYSTGIDEADVRKNRDQSIEAIERTLQEAGVAIKKKFLSTDGTRGHVEFLPLRNEVVIYSLDKSKVTSIKLSSSNGLVAKWDAFEGNEVKYKSAG